MNFGQKLVQSMIKIFNLFLLPLQILETISRHFYDLDTFLIIVSAHF